MFVFKSVKNSSMTYEPKFNQYLMNFFVDPSKYKVLLQRLLKVYHKQRDVWRTNKRANIFAIVVKHVKTWSTSVFYLLSEIYVPLVNLFNVQDTCENWSYLFFNWQLSLLHRGRPYMCLCWISYSISWSVLVFCHLWPSANRTAACGRKLGCIFKTFFLFSVEIVCIFTWLSNFRVQFITLV